ncbi:MgtC/SapB family protein [Salmonirosea aquatica]|uniref:MgtC/SapB family protein n=1 Tax=Salmonirosea aquatica TaxID=2654236 RepID=A0A7C9BDS7_9BACT|nr:MgtC/SapB family protein [Cytophagaceae bacterium SJW1-29]
MEFYSEEIIKLLISFAAGAVIGFEREYRSKPAGLRTLILISLGSTLFTIISIRIGGDPSRIAANVVTGIGFLGGGIIFREADRIVGTTTAATIWVTAALGVCVGSGHYDLTVVCFFLLLFSLVVMNFVEKKFINFKNQARNYRIVSLYHHKMLKHYEELFEDYGLKVKRGKQNRSGDRISGSWLLEGSEKEHEKLTKRLLNDPEIIELDF